MSARVGVTQSSANHSEHETRNLQYLYIYISNISKGDTITKRNKHVIKRLKRPNKSRYMINN